MKKHLLFSLSAFFLFSFAGCGTTANPSPSETASPVSSEQQSAAPTPEISFDQAYSSLKSEYKSNNNFQVCMTRSADACLQPIILEAIRAKGDTSPCNDNILQISKERCEQNSYWQSAIDQKNPTLCEKLSSTDTKDQCKQEVQSQKAISDKNPLECNVLPEGGSRDACLQKAVFEILQKDPDEKWCKDLPTEMIVACQSHVKELKGTPTPSAR